MLFLDIISLRLLIQLWCHVVITLCKYYDAVFRPTPDPFFLFFFYLTQVLCVVWEEAKVWEKAISFYPFNLPHQPLNLKHSFVQTFSPFTLLSGRGRRRRRKRRAQSRIYVHGLCCAYEHALVSARKGRKKVGRKRRENTFFRGAIKHSAGRKLPKTRKTT